MKKILEKAIKAHDGKYPVPQLTKSDLDKWDGVNLQGNAAEPPDKTQDVLALYILDVGGGKGKRFTVTKSIVYLLSRGTQKIFYGTSDANGHQIKVILQWEKEERTNNPRVAFK